VQLVPTFSIAGDTINEFHSLHINILTTERDISTDIRDRFKLAFATFCRLRLSQCIFFNQKLTPAPKTAVIQSKVRAV